MGAHAAIAESNGLFGAVQDRVAALLAALKQPDRWRLLSSCDWYPDPTLYPSNHAALVMLDSDADSTAR